jgi:hypothetical protein
MMPTQCKEFNFQCGLYYMLILSYNLLLLETEYFIS